MIHSFYHSSTGTVTMDLPPEDWPMALRDQMGVLWVDFHAAPLAEVEPHLREPFGFHALAIDDALRERHVPKVDDWGDYLYAVVHGMMFDPKSLALTTRELDIFLRAKLFRHASPPGHRCGGAGLAEYLQRSAAACPRCRLPALPRVGCAHGGLHAGH